MSPNCVYGAICTSALVPMRGAPWAEELARALGGKKLGKQWSACCPAHEDKSPSLNICEGARAPCGSAARPAVSRSRSSPKYSGTKSPTACRYAAARRAVVHRRSLPQRRYAETFTLAACNQSLTVNALVVPVGGALFPDRPGQSWRAIK